MNIYNNYLFLNKDYSDNKNLKYKQNFCANFTRTVGKINLAGEELSQATDILSHYKHLQLLYKASGDFIGGLLKKSIAFLLPASATMLTLKGGLNSENKEDVIIDGSNTTPDSFLTLTVSKGQDNDIAQINVSKSGQATVITEENISKEETDRYFNEISKNHDKLFETVLEKTKTALISADEILKDGYGNKVDLNSPEQIQKAITRFIEEKKRITVLTQMVNKAKFFPRFLAETGTTIQNEGSIKDKDITFSFLGVENQYFDGINLTVNDNKNGTIQGFVAMSDGFLYKTPVFKQDEHMPFDVWVRNLTALSDEERNSPEIKYMFDYVFTHTDLVFKYILDEFYKGDHAKTPSLDKMNERRSAPKKETIDKPLAEERAKVVKVYQLEPDLMSDMEKIENYKSRITKAYNAGFRQQETLEAIEKNSGLLRRKNVNDFILKDVPLPNGMSLGISKYSYSDKDKELISFDIYDENLKQIARYKIMQDGRARVFVKLTADKDFIQSIKQITDTEFNKELTQQIIPILKDACFYHENFFDIKRYIERSYSPITVKQAIQEMQAPPKTYRLDEVQVKNLRANLENISTIYRDYPYIEYYYPSEFFTNIPSKLRVYAHNKLDNLDINYNAIILGRKVMSGFRILINDNDGNMTNCYYISDKGEALKIISMPKSKDIRDLNMNITNFSRLNEDGVKAEHLDLIFEDLCQQAEAYNEFLKECVEKHKSAPLEIPPKPKTQKQNNPDTVKRKPGRPRKNPLDTTEKPVRKPGRPKKEVTDATPKPVQKPKTKKRPVVVKPKEKPATKTSNTSEKQIKKTTIQASPVSTKPKTTEVTPAPITPAAKIKPPKPFESISIADVVSRIEKIFATPYEERSSHLIHDITDRGIFMNRFSITASDGAWVTVTRVQSGMSFNYYSIRVQKGNEVMYMNINPKTSRILRCDHDNKIMRGDEEELLTINKERFAAKNPLSQNMSNYFDELFAETQDTERKTIPYQIFKKQDMVAKQAMRDFERAMEIAELEKMAKIMEAEYADEICETDESEEE